MQPLWTAFLELLRTPFQETVLIWGVVPLYFAWVLNELTSARANYRTAIQTGFSFVWAGLHWLFPYLEPNAHGVPRLQLGAMLPVNLCVTFLVLALGCVAFYSGVRKRYPKYGAFLGQTRFANYFMIAIFPIQARVLAWTWNYLLAIVVFAIPLWLVLHLGLMPVRNWKRRSSTKS